MINPIPVKGRSHFGSNYWDAYSVKLNRDVHFYSDLEYDHWVLVEMNPHTDTFCEQPLKISGTFAEKKVSSTFDMWIKNNNGTETFIEVKYSNDLLPSSSRFEDVMRQTTVQREWCKQNGYQYKIVTEKEIRGNKIYLENLKVILPYINYRYIETENFKVIKAVREGAKSLEDVCRFIPQLPRYKVKRILYYLIYKQLIDSNIENIPLGYGTEVWIDGESKNS